jgi:isoamylase
VWYGRNLDSPAWNDPELRTLCYQLDGSEQASELGHYRLFFILNADPGLQHVTLPLLWDGAQWGRLVDTSLPASEEIALPGNEVPLDPPGFYLANPHSTVVLLGR